MNNVKEELAKKYSSQMSGIGGAFEKDMYNLIMKVLTEYETIMGCDSDFGVIDEQPKPKYIHIKCYADDEYRYEWLEEGMWSPLFIKGSDGFWYLDVTIDLETGNILYPDGCIPVAPKELNGEPSGPSSGIDNFKTCDCGTYTIYDKDHNVIDVIEGYVPCGCVPPYEHSFGDYITLSVSRDGRKITNLKPYSEINFSEFEENWE